MLTADLVRARRKGDELVLTELKPAARKRAVEIAAGYVRAAEASIGHTRERFEAACAAVPVGVRDRKLAAGLRKLVTDRCELEVGAERDPAELRREVFMQSARARREGPAWDRQQVMASAARVLEMEPEAVEEGLYADVRTAHVLTSWDPIGAEELVAAYELAQVQAVLLRATEVVAEVHDPSPEALRRLFRRIKFHRLLHRIEPLPEQGYRLVISGPYSLFRSVTKYGLQLALVLPVIRECERWRIEARVQWGRERMPLTFRAEGCRTMPADGEAGDHLPDEVRRLLERFEAREGPWTARPNAEVLDLPGVGVCVPDLEFKHRETGARVFLEVLGFWSRDAVLRRVELVERGLPHPILFAVSRRLRVSEAMLDDDLPGALYVYKGALSPAAIEARLERWARPE